MENHLIGEVVPASDLTPETIAAADVNVVGYSAVGGVIDMTSIRIMQK